MLSLPEKYKKGNTIAKSTFVRGAKLAGAEKKRFETSVENIKLNYQIEGFDIPNLINEEYNCQVIMFLRVTLKDLKHAAFIAPILQRCITPLAVIEFTDGVNEQYSFADKRLNKQDKKAVVIENEYLSSSLPLNFDNDLKTLFSLYIDFDTILNRNNKHAYYIEMMTKAFLVFNQGLYANQQKILDNKKLWYDETRVMKLFPLLKILKTQKAQAAKARSIADKSKFNKEVKNTIAELEEVII